MSWFAKQAGCIIISEVNKNMNIDWLVKEICFESSCLQNFRLYSLGTGKFLNSVTKVTLDYSDAENKPDIDEDIKLVHEFFKKLF